MTSVRIITAAQPLYEHLDLFKMYASVPDGSVDGMLLKILKRAMLAVQEYADVAMLPCTLQLVAHDLKPGDTIPLYQGGKTVTTAIDKEGNDVMFTPDVDRIIVDQYATSAIVTYTNEVVGPEAEKLLPVCWELATAIYDGEEASKQASILKKCYWAV